MALKIAILASGNGSNAEAIFEKIEQGLLDAEVVLVISNRPGAGVLKRAEKRNIKTLELDHTAFANRESFDEQLVKHLKACAAELVVLAGYMRILSPYFFSEFADKVINVHPALLPSFKGAHGAADALAYGAKLSGCTVHFVNEHVDDGAIIAQAVIPVCEGENADTLQKRIQQLEHRIFPQTIQWFAEKRLVKEQRWVHLLPSANNSAHPLESANAALYNPPLEKGF